VIGYQLKTHFIIITFLIKNKSHSYELQMSYKLEFVGQK